MMNDENLMKCVYVISTSNNFNNSFLFQYLKVFAHISEMNKMNRIRIISFFLLFMDNVFVYHVLYNNETNRISSGIDLIEMKL